MFLCYIIIRYDNPTLFNTQIILTKIFVFNVLWIQPDILELLRVDSDQLMPPSFWFTSLLINTQRILIIFLVIFDARKSNFILYRIKVTLILVWE